MADEKFEWKEYSVGIPLPRKGLCVLCGIDMEHHAKIETDGIDFKCIVNAKLNPESKTRWVAGSDSSEKK